MIAAVCIQWVLSGLNGAFVEMFASELQRQAVELGACRCWLVGGAVGDGQSCAFSVYVEGGLASNVLGRDALEVQRYILPVRNSTSRRYRRGKSGLISHFTSLP